MRPEGVFQRLAGVPGVRGFAPYPRMFFDDKFTQGLYQNSPVIFPFSSTSIFSAAGAFGSPGIVIISPVSATRNPAPALTFKFRTVTVNPLGAPSFAASSEKLYCV